MRSPKIIQIRTILSLLKLQNRMFPTDTLIIKIQITQILNSTNKQKRLLLNIDIANDRPILNHFQTTLNNLYW